MLANAISEFYLEDDGIGNEGDTRIGQDRFPPNEKRKHRRWVDADCADSELDPLSTEQPALSACYQASAQGEDVLGQRARRPTLRLMTTPLELKTTSEPGLVAVVGGFNLHATTYADGCNRERLERLCQYIGRPPIANGRLHILDDGRVRYDMKRV
jgi:hypothetical protein